MDQIALHVRFRFRTECGLRHRSVVDAGADVFVGDDTLGVLVPTGICTVVAWRTPAHFHHREYVAHFNDVERTLPYYHGECVVGQGHSHLTHVSHAGLAHIHVVGYQGVYPLGEVFLLHADHGRHVVLHRVHRVVRLAAAGGPTTGVVRDELDGTHLAHGSTRRHLRLARAGLNPAAICTGCLEGMAMQVHRVVHRREVAHADAHTVAQTHWQRVDAGEDVAVPRSYVEVGHPGHA